MQENNINKQDFLHATFVVVILLIVYLLSAPRTVVFEDDGLFILAAYYNGIAHPPGYPLYTLLSHMMTWIPFGTIAYRVHALSALFGALACGVLWLVMRNLLPGKVYAYTASLAYGFSHVFWSQAIVAEVYTLHILIIMLLIALAFKFINSSKQNLIQLSIWIGLLYGLGLANHWPLLFLSTPMLIIIVWPRIRQLLRQMPFLIPSILVGLFPYAWLVFRSQMNPEISFYGPLDSWSDFWFMISRAGYQGVDQSLSSGLWDKWMFSIFVIKESARQFGEIGIILILLGFYFQWRVLPIRIIFALILGYLFNTVILIGLLGFDYDLLHRYIFRVYPLTAYLILSVWLAIGLFAVIGWTRNYMHRYLDIKFFIPIAAVFIITFIFLFNVSSNYRANDYWVQRYATILLDSLDKNSILIANTDHFVAPTAYFNLVENYRNDIQIYQPYGLIFNNRIFKIDFLMTEEQRVDQIRNFIANAEKTIQYDDIPITSYAKENFGLYARLNKTEKSDFISFIFNPAIYQYYIKMIEIGEPIDPWQVIMYRHNLSSFCYWMSGLAAFTSGKEKQLFFQDNIEEHCRGFYGYLGQLRKLLVDQSIDWSVANRLIIEAKVYIKQSVTKADEAALYNFEALMLINTDKHLEAKHVIMQSINIWDHPDNDAYDLLKDLQ
ncbi:MAG: glycosyltransferase family 117 protein [Gammaproteobacteria bacterium]